MYSILPKSYVTDLFLKGHTIFQGGLQEQAATNQPSGTSLLDCFYELLEEGVSCGTARTLFFKRLKSDYQNLWEASKLILDWTLFIYLLIPGIAIGAFFYFEWLQNIPIILSLIGWYGWMILLALSFFLHNIKLFTYLADQLFLCRNIPLLRCISQYGIIYSINTILLTATLSFLVAAPFLSKLLSLPLLSLAYLWLYYLSGAVLMTLWKKYAQIHIPSFILRIISNMTILLLWISLSQIIVSLSDLWILWIIFSLAAITVFAGKLAYNGTHFFKIAEMDEQARGKLANLLHIRYVPVNKITPAE